MGNVDRLSNILIAATSEATSGAATGGYITAAVIVKEAGGALVDWLSRREKIEPFAAEAVKNFDVWADINSIEKVARERAVDEAADLFLKAGVTPREFTQKNLKAETVAQEAIGTIPASDATRHMLICMYEWFRHDPDFQEDFDSAFRDETLERSADQGNTLREVDKNVKHLLALQPEAEVLFKKPRNWLPRNGPSALLNSDYRVVPFWGRTGELEDLRQWCANEAEFGIRLYTGKGGMGKTRLLMELAEQQKTQGWIAEFINKDTGEPTLKQAAQQLLKTGRPVLLVVDYAETQPAMVTSLIQAFEDCTVFRLVLLARSSGDWWDQLRRCGGVAGDILCGPAVEGPFEINPLADSLDKREGIYQEACKAFAETLEKPEPSGTLHKPEHTMYQRVLYIHLAALAAVQGEAPKQTPEDLLKYIVDKERRFLDTRCAAADGCGALADAGILQAAAMATLAGTMNKTQAQAMLARCPLLEDQAKVVREKVLAILHETYPGTDYISGVQPDIVGEHLVATALEEDQSLLDAFFGQEDESPEYQSHTEHGLTVLTRLAQQENKQEEDKNKHLSYVFEKYLHRLYKQGMMVAVRQGDPVGKVMAQALGEKKIPQIAVNIILHSSALSKVFEQSINLIEVHFEAYRLAILHWRQTPDNDFSQQEMHANLLNNYSVYLYDLSMYEEALLYIEEAISKGQKLVAANPDLYSPGLANSYDNHAMLLTKLNRFSEAEPISRDAVDIKKSIISEPEHHIELGYNTSLGNLIVILRERQKYGEALSKSEELLQIERKINLLTGGETKQALAGSLVNHGAILREVGRVQEAYDTIFEGVIFYRELVEKRPDIHLPKLAIALNNMAGVLSNLNRHKEAIDSAQEAIDILIPLAKQRNEVFTPELVRSISTKAAVYYSINEPKNALPLYYEAMRLLFPFFSKRTRAYFILMFPIYQKYLELSEITGSKLDTVLLDSIVEIFKKFDPPDNNGG